MSYRIEFLGIAEEELDDAIEWYASQQQNLSATFVLALDTLLEHIQSNPQLFSKVHNDLRKAPIRNFPYNIIYEVHNPDVVLILAIAHQRQNPKRWIER